LLRTLSNPRKDYVEVGSCEKFNRYIQKKGVTDEDKKNHKGDTAVTTYSCGWNLMQSQVKVTSRNKKEVCLRATQLLVEFEGDTTVTVATWKPPKRLSAACECEKTNYDEAAIEHERWHLEAGTNRLLDGMHRFKARRQIGAKDIEAEFRSVPDGIPAKLFAASFSTTHGDPISGEDLKEIARETITANPEFSVQTVAQMLGKHRETVGKWVSDITERRRQVRKVKAILLHRLGWTNVEIADFLEVSEMQIRRDVESDITSNLTEDLLRTAMEELPEDNGELAEVADYLREQLIFASWSEEERELLAELRSGSTVVVKQGVMNSQ
jgi:hypothetical protein